MRSLQVVTATFLFFLWGCVHDLCLDEDYRVVSNVHRVYSVAILGYGTRERETRGCNCKFGREHDVRWSARECR